MTRQLIGIPILAAAMLTGCGQESPTPRSGNGASAEREATEAAAKAADDTKAAAEAKIAADQKAAADTKAAADAKIAADLKAAAEAKKAADAKAAADVKTAADAVDAANAAAKAADDANAAKAMSLLEQLQQYIKDNKLELAEKTLDQLDGMKGSLPTSLQDKIEAARATLNAQKAAAMFK